MRMPIDEAPAGLALNAAVAKVLGLAVQWKQWGGEIQPVYLAGTYAARDAGWAEHEDWRRVLSYSTDIAAACVLLEWLRNQFAYEDIPIRLSGSQDSWDCEVAVDRGCWDDPGEFALYQGSGETVTLAICRAFLKANRMTHVEVPE